MSESTCPICYGPLETRDVAPCWDCGAGPVELEHLTKGRHNYAEFIVFNSKIILCDFCQVDFGSCAPNYFGQGRRAMYGKDLLFVREIVEVRICKDKYCEACDRRLAFLKFLATVREDGLASSGGCIDAASAVSI